MAKSTGSGSATKMVQNIADAVSGVQETASEVGRHTTDKIDAIRETIAGTMDETSSVIKQGGEQVSEIAESAVQKIQEGAEYVRETDLRVMGADVKGFVKRFPVASVAVGLGVGFLLAWSLRRSE
jgi:ElaB/YqjD/DUF883 family membrane-anchored ribosome-binding protein